MIRLCTCAPRTHSIVTYIFLSGEFHRHEVASFIFYFLLPLHCLLVMREDEKLYWGLRRCRCLCVLLEWQMVVLYNKGNTCPVFSLRQKTFKLLQETSTLRRRTKLFTVCMFHKWYTSRPCPALGNVDCLHESGRSTKWALWLIFVFVQIRPTSCCLPASYKSRPTNFSGRFAVYVKENLTKGLFSP